jgi:Ca2+-binding RTX toxin-like protein
VTGPGTDVIYDNTTGQWAHVVADPYVGPIPGLTSEFIATTTDNLDIWSTSPKFITTSTDNLDIWSTSPNQYIKASGNDAINVTYGAGNNVLDGGEGSNFLTGGGGNDTFFVEDLTNTQATWNTLINFHQGDNATIWGIGPADFNLSWGDNAGNSIYKGLTLYATSATRPEAAVTIAGLSTADLGRDLKVVFGNVAGYNYMELSHV